jgi:hypothetical protein
MNSDNQTKQDYINLPMDQTGNNFVPSIIENNYENFQCASNPNINNSSTTALSPQNNTFEFYLSLPNDRIYHVAYTELNSTEITQLLNNRIDLSHIPNHRLPYHYNVQYLIRQQFVQQSVDYTILQQSLDTINVQTNFQEYSNDNAYDASLISPVQQPVDYQQDTIPKQSFDTISIQPTFQEYSDNNAYDVSSIPPIQQTVDNQQDTIPHQSFDNIRFEFYLPLPNDEYIYHVTYTELNLREIARFLNNRIDLSYIPDHRLVQQSVGYQQDTVSQQSFGTTDIQSTLQEYSDNNDASSVPPNSSEDISRYDGVQLHQNNQD